MLHEIPASQLADWRAYSDIEPWDEERADRRAEYIVMTLRNLWRPKNARPVSLQDVRLLQFLDTEPTAPRTVTRPTSAKVVKIRPQQPWQMQKALEKAMFDEYTRAQQEKHGA